MKTANSRLKSTNPGGAKLNRRLRIDLQEDLQQLTRDVAAAQAQTVSTLSLDEHDLTGHIRLKLERGLNATRHSDGSITLDLV